MTIRNLEEQLNSFFNWTDRLLAGQIYGAGELFSEIEKDILGRPEKCLLPEAQELFQEIGKELKEEEIEKLKSKYKSDSEILQELTHLLKGYSKDACREKIVKRFNSRYGTDSDLIIGVLEITPKVQVNIIGPPYLTAKIIYSIQKSNEFQGKGKVVLYLYSRDELWAGVDLEENLEPAFKWIDQGVIGGSSWKDVEAGSGIEMGALRELAGRLRGYLPSTIRKLVRETVESRYGSKLDPEMVIINEEVRQNIVDGIEPSVVITLPWSVQIQGIREEETEMTLTINSKDDIKIEWVEDT